MNTQLETPTSSEWFTFVIQGSGKALDTFLSDLENRLPPGWSRATDLEQRILSMGFAIGGNRIFAFSDPNRGRMLSLTLARIGDRLQGGLSVPANSSVPMEEVTRLEREFVNQTLLPLAAERGLSIGSREVPDPLQSHLSDGGWFSLQEFVRFANKTDSVLAIEDRRRWNRFLVKAHRGAGKPTSEQLSDWLISKGFAPQLVERLVGEYELGTDLLEEYDEEMRLTWNR